MKATTICLLGLITKISGSMRRSLIWLICTFLFCQSNQGLARSDHPCLYFEEQMSGEDALHDPYNFEYATEVAINSHYNLTVIGSRLIISDESEHVIDQISVKQEEYGIVDHIWIDSEGNAYVFGDNNRFYIEINGSKNNPSFGSKTELETLNRDKCEYGHDVRCRFASPIVLESMNRLMVIGYDLSQVRRTIFIHRGVSKIIPELTGKKVRVVHEDLAEEYVVASSEDRNYVLGIGGYICSY